MKKRKRRGLCLGERKRVWEVKTFSFSSFRVSNLNLSRVFVSKNKNCPVFREIPLLSVLIFFLQCRYGTRYLQTAETNSRPPELFRKCAADVALKSAAPTR